MNQEIIGFGRGLGRSALWAGLFSSFVYAEPTMALRNVKPGDTIPPFTVQCLDGTSLAKADLSGKTTVLLFVRPEHRASLSALQEANRVRRDYGGAALAVVAVSTDEAAEPYFSRIVEDHHLTVPIGLDRGRAMYGSYGVVVAPTTLLIDAQGVLRFELQHLPPNYTDHLRRHLDLLLGRISTEEHDASLSFAKPTVPEPTSKLQRRLAMCESLMANGDFAQALSILTALNADRADARVILLLGRCHLQMGHVPVAAELLESPTLTEAKLEGLPLARARLAVARHQDERAKELLLAALVDADDPVSVLYELGRLYERQSNCAQAAASYRKALEKLLEKP